MLRKSSSACFGVVEDCLPPSLQPTYQAMRLGDRFTELQFESAERVDGGSDTRLTARFSTLKVFYAR